MKIDDILAKHIGDLTIENAKLRMAVEAMRSELHKRDEIIRKLNETGTEMPFDSARPASNEGRNGTH